VDQHEADGSEGLGNKAGKDAERRDKENHRVGKGRGRGNDPNPFRNVGDAKNGTAGLR